MALLTWTPQLRTTAVVPDATLVRDFTVCPALADLRSRRSCYAVSVVGDFSEHLLESQHGLKHLQDFKSHHDKPQRRQRNKDDHPPALPECNSLSTAFTVSHYLISILFSRSTRLIQFSLTRWTPPHVSMAC